MGNALTSEDRAALLEGLKELVGGARRSGWFIVFTGLRFPSGYANVNPRHRLYGGLKRLNAKQGDERAHWFMEGHSGAEIDPALEQQEGDAVIWRQGHTPPRELSDV